MTLVPEFDLNFMYYRYGCPLQVILFYSLPILDGVQTTCMILSVVEFCRWLLGSRALLALKARYSLLILIISIMFIIVGWG